MAVGDEIVEAPLSSLLIDSLESNTSGDALSAEDVAWVDSCLVKDSEISDSNWSSLRGALLEIIGLQPESNESSAPRSDGFPVGTDMELLPSSEVRIMQSSGGNNDDFVVITKQPETSNDESQSIQGDDITEISLRYAFLPNYNEDDDQRVSIAADSGFEMGFPAFEKEIEPSTDDIFKVWDLGIPAEEDELVKQLKNALLESSVQSMPAVSDDSQAWKDLEDETLDNLIAGIADLSLNQHSA